MGNGGVFMVSSRNSVVFLFSAATKCESGDPEAQRHWAGCHVPIQTPQRISVQQGPLSQAHQ